MRKVEIIRFAQSLTEYKGSQPVKDQKYGYWYETTQGEKIKCNDSFIDMLWRNWLKNAKGDNEKINGHTVFTFKEPFKIEDK